MAKLIYVLVHFVLILSEFRTLARQRQCFSYSCDARNDQNSNCPFNEDSFDVIDCDSYCVEKYELIMVNDFGIESNSTDFKFPKSSIKEAQYSGGQLTSYPYVVIYEAPQTLTLWLEETSGNFRVWTTKYGRLKTFLGIYQKQIVKKCFQRLNINVLKVAVFVKSDVTTAQLAVSARAFFVLPLSLNRWFLDLKNVFW